jgi:hypothetical protein
MNAFTHVGDGPVQIVCIGAIYWLFSRGVAIRLAILLMVTGALNGLLKQTFAAPRPSWINDGLNTGMPLSSFGMPSGHAQSATVWFLVPQRTRNAHLLCWVFVYVFAIGYSRVITGVHTWDQVFMGWAIGMACLQTYLWFEPKIIVAMPELSFITLGLLVVSAIAGVLYLGADAVDRIPAETLEVWRAYADRKGIHSAGPAGLRHIVAPLGCLTGFVTGGWLDAALPWTQARTWAIRAGRLVVGSMVTGGIYFILKTTLPIDGESVLSLCARFGSAAFLGFSAFYLAPQLMRRLGLLE